MAGVDKCPGWQKTSCGKVPDEGSNKYWQHHCNPLAVPSNSSGIRLACEAQPNAETGKFQCYFSQPGSFLASLGMKCVHAFAHFVCYCL